MISVKQIKKVEVIECIVVDKANQVELFIILEQVIKIISILLLSILLLQKLNEYL